MEMLNLFYPYRSLCLQFLRLFQPIQELEQFVNVSSKTKKSFRMESLSFLPKMTDPWISPFLANYQQPMTLVDWGESLVMTAKI